MFDELSLEAMFVVTKKRLPRVIAMEVHKINAMMLDAFGSNTPRKDKLEIIKKTHVKMAELLDDKLIEGVRKEYKKLSDELLVFATNLIKTTR